MKQVRFSRTLLLVSLACFVLKRERPETVFFPLNGNLALSYARFEGRKETISSSPQGKIAIQPKNYDGKPDLNQLRER